MVRKPKILCVDDQVANLGIRVRLLQQWGCEPIAVHDHISALRVVTETNVDLAVIDYRLGTGSTGEDVARDLRRINPKLPLVMLTGYLALPDSARECVDAVVFKGQNGPRELLESIRRLLPDAPLKPSRSVRGKEPPAKAS